MDLIKKLGGYEKAKEIAFDPLHPQMTHVSNDGRHWVNEEFSHIPEIQEQIPTMVRIEDIRKTLLEYRRQHNIFEVGDYVLRNDGFYNVLRITGINSGCADLVRRVDGEPRWSRFNLTDIHHATDEEIAAGHRL